MNGAEKDRQQEANNQLAFQENAGTLRLDPFSPQVNLVRGVLLQIDRRFDESKGAPLFRLFQGRDISQSS